MWKIYGEWVGEGKACVNNCPDCNSQNIIKKGSWLRGSDRVPKLLCKDCGRYFSAEYLDPDARSQINRANALQNQKIVDEWTHKRIVELRKQGLDKPTIAKRLEISPHTVYDHLKQEGLIEPRQQKTYTLVSPDGEAVDIQGVRRFAEANGMNYHTAKDFLTRRWRSRNWYSHKGWSKPGMVKPPKKSHPWRIEAKNRIEYFRKLKMAQSRSQ